MIAREQFFFGVRCAGCNGLLGHQRLQLYCPVLLPITSTSTHHPSTEGLHDLPGGAEAHQDRSDIRLWSTLRMRISFIDYIDTHPKSIHESLIYRELEPGGHIIHMRGRIGHESMSPQRCLKKKKLQKRCPVIPEYHHNNDSSRNGSSTDVSFSSRLRGHLGTYSSIPSGTHPPKVPS